jgi:hypothetical protein
MLRRSRSNWRPAAIPALLIAASIFLNRLPIASAQNAAPAAAPASAATEDRVKALERERDELKRRNDVLEGRLKQLLATVNKIAGDTLDPILSAQPGAPPPAPHPPGEPPVTSPPLPPSMNAYPMVSWKSLGPAYTRAGGIFSPLQQPVDLVSLAVAYRDALGDVRRARQAIDAKENKPNVDLESAERKVGLLRSITKAARDQLADEVDRMHKLGAIHAVPMMDVRNLETKLKILDLILEQDPDAAPTSNEPAAAKPAQPPPKSK